MTKLYKAVDKMDAGAGYKCWLLNDKGLAVSYWYLSDEEEVKANMISESGFMYISTARFKNDAINPILIAEW